MQANRQHSSWNPQIAIAVVAVGILAAVWLNMAKLKMGMGQPQHDISQVPIAQNITSDEIEQLRTGKPLELILAERPDYEQLTASATAPSNQTSAKLTPPTEPNAQTATALSSQPPTTMPPAGFAPAQTAFPPPAPQPAPPETEPKHGFRLPLRDPDVAAVAFSEETRDSSKDARGRAQSAAGDDEQRDISTSELTKSSHAEPASPQVSPTEVPRANPVSGSGDGGGGSFLEKFPGHSQQLPNLKHGPAQNAPAPPLFPEPVANPPAELPTAKELAPLPFGDLLPTATENSASTLSAPAEPTLARPDSEPPMVPAREQGPIARPGIARPGAVQARPINPSQRPSTLERSQTEEAEFPLVLTKEGETWWTLAQRVYDDGRLFRELYEFNRSNFPDYDVLSAGSEVTCPPRELLLRRSAAEAGAELPQATPSAQRYRTRSGETLFDIARGQLGQASRFAELLQLNRDRLPSGAGHLTPLPVGTELLLPLR